MEMTERHVQAVWYDAALRPKRLFTIRGNAVSVIYPGDWNLEAGPDFRNAVLEVGRSRRRISGDVEVHVCPADWDLHRHGSDPAYRNVIAHVTWRCGAQPATLPENAISIWLGKFAAANPRFSPEAIDLTAYPYSCTPVEGAASQTGEDLSRLLQAVSAAGRRRLVMKARRLCGRIGASNGNRRQVFYEEVMTALGYRCNAKEFRRLAERVPLASLPADAAAAANALSVAADFDEWSRSGVRPNNAPARRIDCAARLFTATEVMNLTMVRDFSRQACQGMVKLMCEGRLMGKGRAGAIVANVIAPFAVAEGHVADIPEWLPPEDVSSPVRIMAHRLFGRDHNPAIYCTNGIMLQGLIGLYDELRRLTDIDEYAIIWGNECERRSRAD